MAETLRCKLLGHPWLLASAEKNLWRCKRGCGDALGFAVPYLDGSIGYGPPDRRKVMD
jgi:hypothetical protein